jgi:hypothetical protein
MKSNLDAIRIMFEQRFDRLSSSEVATRENYQKQQQVIEKKGKDLFAFSSETKGERKEMIKKHSGGILR